MKTIIGNKSSGWSYDLENNTIILSEYVSTFEKIFQKKTGVTTLFVDHIDRIKVYYTNTPMPPYGQIGHYIYFKILGKDGSNVSFRAYYGEKTKEKFLKTFDILKNVVCIEDENNLIDNIRNNNIAAYIEKLEKSKR